MDRRKPRGQGVGPGPRPDHASVSILPVCQKRISRVRPGPVSVTAEGSVSGPGLRPDAGLPANGRRARAPPPGTILSRHHASTLGLLYMVFSRDASARHALASPSRRSQPRGSAHVTSAPGAFGPVGRRATGTRAATLSKPLFAAMSYVGACAHPNWRTRINNTEHKPYAARTINLSRPHFSHDGHESE